MRLNRRTFLQTTLAAGITNTALGRDAHAWTPGPARPTLPDEDGYDLWLRYRPVSDSDLLEKYRSAMTGVVQLATSSIAQSINDELVLACNGMLGHSPTLTKSVDTDGTILIGTPTASPAILTAVGASQFEDIGNEGFILKSTLIDGHKTTIITANQEPGLLHGAFALIKRMQLRQPIESLDIADAPRANLRLVNHWDDMDRSIDRGYSGLSIFHFANLSAPNTRYIDYARLLASVGINGTVINNVDADAAFLASEMMEGYAHLASILRAWGIRLYLSVNFASPIDLTAREPTPVATADPLAPDVQNWWSAKVEEIYDAVPDFGGFLVKANSEGEPGPLNYNRTHAQGANMLARALAPHNGILLWRSFVHQGFHGWSEFEYDTFHSLDGQFDRNVIVQTKNGPIDFQVQEPVNPLFGAMPRTNQMIELQITQEYTGHATHLCYLPTYWSKVLSFNTHIAGDGPTVSEIVDGSADGQSLTGLAGVINFGDDRNWTGSHLAAANTHGFARLAWNHQLAAAEIATEWTNLTFGVDQHVANTLVPMLLSSWQTYKNYTTPFGIGYLTRPTGAHYLPDPRGTENLTHFTDSQGSGYDRTLATGSGFTRFYSDHWFDIYEQLSSCPEELMMFLHVVPWGHQLVDGTATIQQLFDLHFEGVEQVGAMQRDWQELEGLVDQQRFAAISRQFLAHQFQSRVWRDVLLSYYFDIARIVSDRQPWVQLELEHSPSLLFGGISNAVTGSLTNATASLQKLGISIDASQKGWTSPTVEESLQPRESRDVTIPISPPIEPYLGPISFTCIPPGLTTLGFDTQTMLVTPPAKQCTLALDIGTKPESVISGYTSLTASNIWDSSRAAGWIEPPTDLWLGDEWGPMLGHCATGADPHTLRLRIPAGKQRAWVLIGGQGTGSQPVRISDGKHILVETGYLAESVFQWFDFTLDGGANGATIDLEIEGADGRVWRLSALVVLKPRL